MSIRPRDYVATSDGLGFAILCAEQEADRLPASLRYQRQQEEWQKLTTPQAWKVLCEEYPQYTYHSERWDCRLAGISLPQITRHYSAHQRAMELLRSPGSDRLECDCHHVLEALVENKVNPLSMGITGSVLLRAHRSPSDVDLVVDNAQDFQLAREFFQQHLQSEPIAETAWREAYAKRNCCLDFAEYVWHERRKLNKCWYRGRKFDLSLNRSPPVSALVAGRKLHQVTTEARIIDSSHAFDFPAVWRIESPLASQLLSWTATYIGQAFDGELVTVAGWLEETNRGSRRILVGSSREARGEFIRVHR